MLYLGMKLGHWQKDSEVAHILSFYTKGLQLNQFSIYGQRFPRYRSVCNISIFEFDTWALVQIPKVVHIAFLPQRVEIGLIFARWAVVPDIRADFRNCHIWA